MVGNDDEGCVEYGGLAVAGRGGEEVSEMKGSGNGTHGHRLESKGKGA